MKATGHWTLGVVFVLAVLVGACGGGEDRMAAAMDEELVALEDLYSALEAKRVELRDLNEQMAAAATAEEEAGEAEAPAEGEEVEAMPSGEEMAAGIETLEGEIEGMSESYMTALVTFLNSANMVEGEEVPAPVQRAIEMKSAEDMLIAEEYIWEGGDYRRAIEILETALMLDADNATLQAARDKAASDQYMTEERFAAVSKGMTQEEVRATIGTVNRHNLREYPEKNVIAWFYRREDKGAAGVWFEEKDGELLVYRADFNAIESPEEGGAEAGEEGADG